MFNELKRTHRGFRFYEFNDRNNLRCSLQKSSVATEDCIWLGLNSANPKNLIYGKGWVDASQKIPEGIEFTTRMHLTQKQAGVLAKQLDYFSETGDLPRVEISQLAPRKLPEPVSKDGENSP